MDKIKADKLFKQINGKEIEGISITSLKNHGKSAAVFVGEKNGKSFAIKIFDEDIVERYGVEVQQHRVELELSLKNHNIPNLVKILGGGHVPIDSVEYFFLIMELIDGKNLKEYIENNTITTDFVVKVITTLVTVTETLLQRNPPLAHRDIKPENIMVSDRGDIILMDLGVLKIVGAPSISDVDAKQFLGTLRYAPPEFLTREEVDSIDGWRAVNIYQIGAVLHDLIMKKELFSGTEPYAKLVIEIEEDMPKIDNPAFHPDLIQMARNMLQKNWRRRLTISSIDAIKATLDKCLLPQEAPVNRYSNIKTKSLSIKAELEQIDKISRSLEEKEKKRAEIHGGIWRIIDDCFSDLNNDEIINTVEKSEAFKLESSINKKNLRTSYKIYKITGKFDSGFTRPVVILFNILNDEYSYCIVNVTGILLDIFYKNAIDKPEDMLFSIYEQGKINPRLPREVAIAENITISFTEIFDGIIELGDNNFKTIINRKIELILEKAVNIMEPEIEEELKSRKERIGAGPSVYVTMHSSSRPIFIDAKED